MSWMENHQWKTAKQARESFIRGMSQSGFKHVKGAGKYTCWLDEHMNPFVLILLVQKVGDHYAVNDLVSGSSYCPHSLDPRCAHWLQDTLKRIGKEPDDVEQQWIDNSLRREAVLTWCKTLTPGTMVTLNVDVGSIPAGTRLEYRTPGKQGRMVVLNPNGNRFCIIRAEQCKEFKEA